MKKQTRKIIDDDLYLCRFYVQLGGDIQAAHDWFSRNTYAERKLLDRSYYRGGIFSEHDGWKGGLIWVDSLNNIPAIAHEVFHAVHHVLDRMRIKLSHDSDEVFAYYIEFLMKKILEK